MTKRRAPWVTRTPLSPQGGPGLYAEIGVCLGADVVDPHDAVVLHALLRHHGVVRVGG